MWLRDCSKADGAADTAQITQGGKPPYLRAAQMEAAFRLSEAASIWAAVIILGSPPPLGEDARDGCRRQPPTMRHKPKEGATDCAHYGWGGGGKIVPVRSDRRELRAGGGDLATACVTLRP